MSTLSQDDERLPILSVRRLAAWLGAFEGWRRSLAGFLLGGLGALALPPLCAVPVLFLVMPGFLWLLAGTRTLRQAFVFGWWFGFGSFFFGLYWVSFALLVDVGRYGWLIPIAATGLPAALALTTGALATIHRGLGWRGVGGTLAFAFIWSGGEWLRGHSLTGFPWHLTGYVWFETKEVLQFVSFAGIYGLGLVTMAAAALPACLGEPGRSRGRWAAVLAGITVLAGIAVWGEQRLPEGPVAEVAGLQLRLVQPNIGQATKWASGQLEANFDTHLALSAAPFPRSNAVTLVIWPETAVTFFLEQDLRRRAVLAHALPAGGVALVGAPRVSFSGPHRREFWNSLLAIDEVGAIVASYDKAHLVPFGEYVPMRSWLPEWLPVSSIAAGAADFSAGPGPRTLTLPGIPPFSPTICYEAIFPGGVADGTGRAVWLLNLTNDAWYGRSAGPHQHFAIAAVRAVEEGVPLVRVANTGISGVVDPYGRTVARLDLGERGALDTGLPLPVPDPTPYSRWGDWVFLGLLLLVGLASLFSRQAQPIQ